MKENWLGVKALFAASLLCSTGQLLPEPLVNLHDLALPSENLEDSYSELMELPLGLHLIEPRSDKVNRILIAIHDENTDGFEWTLPLQTMDDESTDTFFIRWDPSECPNSTNEEVRQDISTLLNSNESINQVTIVGHGMGGVYLSQFARSWKALIRLDGHVVAAPLNGTVGVFGDGECGDILPKRLPPTIRIFQWRIDPLQHSLFKEMNEDPQVVDLDGSLVISLPEAIDQNSLDSIRALEIVASRIQAEYLEAIEHSEPVEMQP
ncbi:MAG: hypothetical protein F4X56_04770 [Gammaproteobacteria bacterium]|nr:hypothetical protein [Gammaproteobacteria bacterium]MXW08086.1 hypothetical protein [Gammaproteobacteria bacterium]MYC25214.1 hypothetical protein [Gammaproteobacteria bacterium]